MIHNHIQKLQQQIMPLLFLLLLLLSHSPLLESAPQESCPPSRCRRHHRPTVQFPFRLLGDKHYQPPNCSFPGFDLVCNEKGETILQLPVAVNLIVTKIDYEQQQILLSDPEKCLPKTLQSLNLTSSRFNFSDNGYGFYIKDYVFFNCSGSEGNGDKISCLSGSSYRLYAVESNSNMDTESVTACTRSGNISNVPYSIFGSNDLLLRWDEPACYCRHGMRCVPSNNSSSGHECRPIPSEEWLKKKKIAGWTLGSLLLVTILTALTYLCITIIKDRKNRKKIEKFLEDYRAVKPTRFCYSDIRRITNNFNEKLGEGGFGVVYKAKLSPEIFAAVKVLNNSKENGEEFVNEVSTIGRIHHVNVVRLLGFCAEGFRRVLVYEYLPNESLEKVIFQQESKKNSLGFEKLHEIALGIAKGIEYLHQGCDQQILHFDIKPHNILLDQNYNPKICDFGLAKLCSKEQSAVTMTAARGTMGYIAPELLSRTFGKVSYKSDVYSFGMLLLEMVGGRKNVDNKVENSQVYFPQWIFNHLNLGDEFWAQIEEGEFGNLARKLTIVGLHCIQWYPAERPSMKAVVQMLEGDGSDLSMPSDPFPTNSETNMIGVMNKRHFQIDLPLILENE